MSIAQNYEHICLRIHEAAQKSGRRFEDITIVTVTKTVEPDGMREAFEAGATDFAENRVQEYVRKHEAVDKKIHWHLIGQIQTNKVKYIQNDVVLIHSLDRLALAQALEKQGEKENRVFDTLIEIKLSEENTKSGVSPAEVEDLLAQLTQLNRVRVRGFMTMAPYGTDDESARPYFAELRRLKEKFAEIKADNFDFQHLSMGMTSDYYGAVLEGATIVRIGSAIFKSRS